MSTCPKRPDESPEFWQKWKRLIERIVSLEATSKDVEDAAAEFATLSLAHMVYLYPEAGTCYELRDDDGNYIDSEELLYWKKLTVYVDPKKLEEAKDWAYYLEDQREANREAFSNWMDRR
jgi:hypothetical protein